MALWATMEQMDSKTVKVLKKKNGALEAISDELGLVLTSGIIY